MAIMHILDATKQDTYNVLIHYNIPDISNSAGVPWTELLLRVGVAGKTQLQASVKTTEMVDSGEVDELGDPIMVPETTEVVGCGQMSDAERALIDAGTKVEIPGQIKFSGTLNAAGLTKLAGNVVSDWQTRMIEKYRWYGKTRG